MFRYGGDPPGTTGAFGYLTGDTPPGLSLTAADCAQANSCTAGVGSIGPPPGVTLTAANSVQANSCTDGAVTLVDEAGVPAPTAALARYTLLARQEQLAFLGGFDHIDPAELVTLAFDFSKSATSVADPVFSVTQVSGPVDPSATALLRGLPAVVGGKVYQRVRGRLAGCVYEVRCQVDTPTADRYVMVGLLPVRTARPL